VTFYTRYVSSLSIPSSKSLSDELTVALLRSQILRESLTLSITPQLSMALSTSFCFGIRHGYPCTQMDLSTVTPTSLPFLSLHLPSPLAGQGKVSGITSGHGKARAGQRRGRGRARQSRSLLLNRPGCQLATTWIRMLPKSLP
jgi:hypothetical protein